MLRPRLAAPSPSRRLGQCSEGLPWDAPGQRGRVALAAIPLKLHLPSMTYCLFWGICSGQSKGINMSLHV